MKDRHITVKFMSRNIAKEGDIECWLRQFPGKNPVWGNCRFVFDWNAREYDWLVVYHDLHREKYKQSEEKLKCPKEKTILVTTEPSTITVYGTDYLNQFGHVLTSQEPWAIPHPNAIFSQPGLMWFYGLPFSNDPLNTYCSEDRFKTYDIMQKTTPPQKTKLLSTVCSQREGKITLHSKRVSYTKLLKTDIEDLDIYGHGVKPMTDKAEALDSYKYHIAIENHVYPHHLTEKLPDAFLGYTLPFYYGCPNAGDYFHADSFVPINIDNYKQSLDIIKSTISNNEYQDRLPYIIEARKRVLEKYNLFAVLDHEITRINSQVNQFTLNRKIMNRQTMRIKKPLAGIRSLFQKVMIKSKHRFKLT